MYTNMPVTTASGKDNKGFDGGNGREKGYNYIVISKRTCKNIV